MYGSLRLLLFEAERAWAHSHEMHQESLKLSSTAKSSNDAAAEDATKKSSSLRKHASHRMRRAIQWASQLLSHCQTLYAQSRLSAEDLTQISAYTLILNGRFLRQRFEFDDALVQLSVARRLLDALAAAATNSRAQALAVAFADEIGPEIRYCAHELHRDKAYDIDAVVADVAPKHRSALVQDCDAMLTRLKEESGAVGQERGKLRELSWEGEPVPIRNPELVDVLLKVQDAQGRLTEAEDSAGENKRAGKGARSKRGVASYDAILLALSEAEEVARKLMESQKVRVRHQKTSALMTLFVVDRCNGCRSWYSGHAVCTCIHRLSAPCSTSTAGSPLDVRTSASAACSAEGSPRYTPPFLTQGASRFTSLPCGCQAPRQRPAVPRTDAHIVNR